jgi:hypothetical protein
MLRNGNSDNGISLLGLLLAVVIVLGLLWYIFGRQEAPTTTATPSDGVEVPTTPPTTPITPRAPQ